MKLCNAVLSFAGTEYFVMCEYEEHTGNHKGLMFEWEDGATEVHESYRLRGLNLMKMRAERYLAKHEEK